MQKITAAKLSKNLFHYLDKVKEGEILIVLKNGGEVARIVPPHTREWRKWLTIQPKLKVPPEELIKPLDDIWENNLV